MSTSPASQCALPNGSSRSTPFRITLPAGSYNIRCANEALSLSSSYRVTIAAGQTADFRNRNLE
jgi:hypothetical protein